MVYRAAIIGCGKIGSEFADDPQITDIYTHAGAYKTCPDTELVAVCDKDRTKAEKCRGRWNIPDCYVDYQKMLSESEPDIVSVCTPDATHFDIIRSIICSSKVSAVFAEKPLALDLDQAEYLVNLAEKKDVILAVNYSRRYAGKFSEIREYLHSEEFGDFLTMNGYYTKGTMHNGTHWFDLARFLIGEISRVRGEDTLREQNEDPTLDAYLEFAHGGHGTLHACDATKYSIFEMDILGTRGRVYVRDSGHVVEVYRVADSPYYSGYKSLIISKIYTDVMKDMLLNAIEDIVTSLKTGRKPLCSGEDGIAALKIARAVQRSAAHGNGIVYIR